MPTIDAEHHDLVFRTVVMGADSDTFVGALPLEDGQLNTGPVQGWQPHFTFEAFGHDPWSGDGEAAKKLEAAVAYADAVVLTDALEEGTHYSSTAVERLYRLLGPTRQRIPAAIFGGPALAQEWETLSAQKPVAVVDPAAGKPMDAVKALARMLLRSRMKSTPPPPPADAG